LRDGGWRVGSAAEFLGLSEEEAAYVELRISLCRHLKEKRRERGWTQTRLAEEIGSSQSRIAKAEANDPGVSVDLLIRSLFATGVSNSELAELIGNIGRGRSLVSGSHPALQRGEGGRIE